MEKQVCLFLEGCGLINYIFIVVFLLGLTQSTYLLSSVIDGLLFILDVIIQFFVFISFVIYLRIKNTLNSCYFIQTGR
jgi:hypothetical protein